MIEILSTLIAILVAGLAAGAMVCVLQLTEFLAEYGTIVHHITGKWKPFEDIQDFSQWLLEKAMYSPVSEFFYKLLHCPFCLATWCCAFFSFVIILLSNISFGWIFVITPGAIPIAVWIRNSFVESE